MAAKPSNPSTTVVRSSLDEGGHLDESDTRPPADASTAPPSFVPVGRRAPYFFASGETVGRHQIRRLLGEGGMGRVYLARDMTLGRSVALKVLRRDVLGEAASTRFIEEARVIAALNHPHIVQLYDVGEHGGSLYLALEYIRGETLQQRAEREPLGVDDALRAGRVIADALAHAHGVGIYHCDLKPSNVMLGQDGRLRVVDFGLARTELNSAGNRVEGTPGWMAPEQWSGSHLTDRVDIWALGLIMAKLLDGQGPSGRASLGRSEPPRFDDLPRRIERADVPPVVAHLIERSLEREPGARPTAREWYEGLDRLLEKSTQPLVEEAPFRGLAAFDERHSAFFFGREREIDAFVEQLRAHPVLPIIGPSGAGKSSFLHAGVVPRLRARESTTVLSFRPGRDPIAALARAVLVAGLAPTGHDRTRLMSHDEVASLAHDLRATPTLIAARLATIAVALQSALLLAVDQLEEIFTQGASDADARLFLELLFACTDDPRDPIRVTFTLRDDFLGRVPALGALYVMRGLSGDDLRQAIVGPLRRCGYRFDDDRLVDDMLAEIGVGRAADLPLLQFACRALWDARDAEGRLLLRATYEQMGGVGGALARHADGVWQAAPPAERRMFPKLLLRLVDGTTRRTVDRAALLAGLPADAELALDRLLAARLVAQRVANDGEGVSLEIAHESLLRSWGKLARWLEESREERRLLAELEDATQYWERRGRRPEETWAAADLLAVRRQIARLELELPPHAERFLAAGEKRQQTLRRRARLRLAAIAGLGGVVAAGALGFLAKFRLARSNVGQVDFVFMPFDWVDDQARPVDPAEFPDLTWQLYAAKPGDEHHPGDPLPPELVTSTRQKAPGSRIERVEAPGGMAFLRIDGRGRGGETCPPSWIRLQNMPGYTARGAAPPVWRIELPTCQASTSHTVTIERGPFIYGGPGEPPTKFADYVEPERVVDLQAFAIDRTEVSNAQFQPFARLVSITGYPVPNYPAGGIHVHDGDPGVPVTAIDAFEAEAFCRYMGKQLPSDHEWTKAARGGLTLPGGPNPMPRRLFPWGASLETSCVNAEGERDGSRWVAPAVDFGCGASPYGVLNMAGNVAEWISREGQTSREQSPLRVVRGGNAMSPWELEQTTTVFRNARESRYIEFSIGIRCVAHPTGRLKKKINESRIPDRRRAAQRTVARRSFWQRSN
jgi:eukaryotic-like serine/threonine-protein kinase